jgi:hypothetical protein
MGRKNYNKSAVCTVQAMLRRICTGKKVIFESAREMLLEPRKKFNLSIKLIIIRHGLVDVINRVSPMLQLSCFWLDGFFMLNLGH